MNTSLLSYFVTGAAINFIVQGDPSAVAATVNQLYNYGVVTNLPDTYKENESDKVTVQSDRGRVERGFIAMADNAMRGSLREMVIKSRSNWKTLRALAVEADALATMQEIERVRAYVNRDAATTFFALGHIGAE